nr:hypothetical protein [uncultured Acetatifactor sp.]
MHQKKKRKIGKLVCAVLVTAFLVSLPYTEVSAAPSLEVVSQETQELEFIAYELPVDENRPSLWTILSSLVYIDGSDEGMLIEISIESNGVSSKIGVKDVRVQKKVWYGWSTVATASGCELTNVGTIGCSALYTGAVKGETYRILYTAYGDVDGYIERAGDSGEFVYTY